MRTIIYARYSSDLQNSRSIADQIALCRDRAAHEGWQIIDTFTDEAISGAAGIGEDQRPGLNALLSRIERGGVDQVLAESTSRIARHQGDGFAIRDQLSYFGVRLFTVSQGEIDEIKGWVQGFLDSQARKDIAFNVKRGQRGTVRSGRSPAGLAYGYRKANRLDDRGELVRGLRSIDDDQAEIVRRIFAEYARHRSTRQIAAGLNDDGIPGPTGGTWRASTIGGDRQRKNGILQNRIYIGKIVHERTSKVADPRTRKERIRPNPEADWIEADAPELRIVDDSTWDAVQLLRNAYSTDRPEQARRPKRLLSGIGKCGVCGGGWIVIGRDQWACGKHRDGGGCTNNRTVKTHIYEQKVLDGLRDDMLHPDAVSAYVKEFHESRRRRSQDSAQQRAKLERRHREAAAKVERLVNAIADGGDEFVEIRAILSKARNDRDAIAQQMADLEAFPVITLHPGIADEYRAQVTELTIALDGNGHAQLEAIPKLRALIGTVTVFPAEGRRGVEVEATGRIANMLALATGQDLHASMYVNDGAGSGDRTRITSLEG
ncbi:MAG: recombinase family protein [Sphingobium sp.]|nr:recombinase family protein [Sphingobium sp.]